MEPAEILYLEASLVDKAVSLWKAGQLVAIPTETVYGLAADATNGEAVARIYSAKSRPQFNPLIVHVADSESAQHYVEWNDLADLLARAFWPGPLTLVLKRKKDSPISDLVTAGGDTIAIRCPAHPVAQLLLSTFEGALAAPSANRSGRVSPTTAEHVHEEFGDRILVIDGGPCPVGIESTVVDATGDRPVILRPGTITREMIETVVGPVALPQPSETLLSPGQLESHYAPTLPVRLDATEVKPGEALLAFGPHPIEGGKKSLNLSPKGNLIEAAANLFSYLRTLDDTKYSAIAVMPIPHEGIGEAINDRLKRAAAPRA